MALDAYPSRSNVPEEHTHRIRLLGGNDVNPTVEAGARGVTVVRTGEGAYRVTFAESPGVFVGWSCGFGASAPAGLAGYTAVRGVYNVAARQLDFVVYNSTFVAADIVAGQYIDLHITFRRGGVQ